MDNKNIRDIIDVEIESDPELQELANKKNVVLLAFIDSRVPRQINPARLVRPVINRIDELGIEEVLEDIKLKFKTENKKVYFLINTNGGGLNPSFKIAKAIRYAFKTITVFIPHVAASGGTLLALTGNTIRMGPMSQLSPLDPQTQYLHYGQVSANSLGRVKRKLDKKLAKLHESEVGYPDKHMVKLIDPIIFEEFRSHSMAVTSYMDAILKKSGYDDSERKTLVMKLIYQFPIHDFVIDKNMATDIGLHVESNDVDIKEWNLMRNWFIKYITKETGNHFIRYCIPNADLENQKNTK